MKKALREFPARYKIIPPLLGFTAGILLNEYVGNPWLLIVILAPVLGLIALLSRESRFLLFIPIGILFAAGPFSSTGVRVTSYEGVKTDLEGTIYRPPEKRESGSRFFLDAEYAVSGGKYNPVEGRVIVSTADDTPGLSYGDRVRVIGIRLRPITDFKNPGAFDVKTYYQRQGIYATGFVEGNKQVISFGRDKSYSPVIYSLDRLRLRYGSFVRANFPSPESEILNALTIGDDGGIPPGVRAEFSRAGIAHVLSISGLHVGAIAVVFFLLIKWLLKRSEYLMLRYKVSRIAAALTIPPLFLYTAIAGFGTPAVRAFIMITVFLLAIIAGRNENKLNTLGVAAFVILLWHPWSLFELSFQLSFAAVFGILLAHSFYPFKVGTLSEKAMTLFKTTCAAMFATLPLLVESFGIIPLVSIPVNMIIVPLVELIVVPLGLLSFLAFTISEHLAVPVISVCMHFIRMMLFGIGLILELPWSSISIPPLSTLSLLLFVALGVSVLLASRLKRVYYILPAVALAFLLSAAYPAIRSSAERIMTASFLDTGGDRTIVFFELPGGENVLIDGGYSNLDRNGYIDRYVVGRFLLHSGVNRIETLILTSADKDHLKGAEYLLRNFDVGRIYTNGDKLGSGLWEIIREKNIVWKDLSVTDKVPLGEDSEFAVLKPGGEFVVTDSSRPHPLAVRVVFKNVSVFTGETLYEDGALSSISQNNGERLKSAVLYLRSISADSAFQAFLSAVSPRILITVEPVQSGAVDVSGASATLPGPAYLNTSADGEITLKTDGSGITIQAYAGEKKPELQ